jgi:hypothetical protein
MLIIPTYLARSGVHGIGVYAGDTIKSGEKVWMFNPAVDFVYGSQWLPRLCRQSPEMVDYFCLYSYKRKNQYYYVTDNARFINHSLDANIGFAENGDEIALKDINPGDELLENYLMSYDADDCFVLEMNNIDWRQYFSLDASKRKRIINNIYFSTVSTESLL